MTRLLPSSVCALTGALLLAACPPPASDPGGPMVIFGDPDAPLPLAFSAYPFPNDLMRTADGIQVQLEDFGEERLPDEPAMSETTAAALAERDGFSGTAAVMIAFDAPLDVATLPATPEDRGTVKLVGLSGPHALQAIPARVRFRSDEHRLFISPHYGHRLLAGQTYAAIVTTGVRGTDGKPVRRSPGLQKALESHTAYAPLRSQLAALGLSMDDVGAATVFTIDDATRELQALKDAVDAQPIPTLTRTRVFPETGYSLDRLFGVPSSEELGYKDGAVPHGSIAHVIHGTFRQPLFVADAPGKNGVITFNDDGTPQIKGEEDILFTLVLPANPPSVTAMPLVIYTHGLGGQRSDVLMVAEALCQRGFAVAGIDLPFHGSRTPPLPARDRVNNITGEQYPDGIGDGAGLVSAFSSFGITSDTEGILPMTPTVVRDSLRQGSADLMGLLRALLDGDKAPLVDGLPGYDGLQFSDAFSMGESYGSMNGVAAVALEPRFEAAFFSVGGGGLVVDLLLNSPQYGPPFGIFLYQRLGLQDVLGESLGVDYAVHPPELESRFQLFQNVVDAADPIAFAPRIAAHPLGAGARSAVFVAPFSDESVPNQAQESLAMAAGASAIRHGDGPELRYGKMEIVDGPVQGNVNGATVAFAQFNPATHGMITRRDGERTMEPGFPPFTALPSKVPVDNPTDTLLRMAADFFESGLSGTPSVRVP